MIDQSKLRSPAWQRVVAEMSAGVPDDRAFLVRSLDIMAQVSGARVGVLLALDPAGEAGEPEPRALLTWPVNGPGIPADLQPDLRVAARGAASSGDLQVFALEGGGGPFYDGSKPGYILVVPIPPGPVEANTGPRMVVALIVESRSSSALQTTLAILELLSGYAHGHAARQNLRRARAAAAALDLAGRLVSTLNTPGTFKGCTLQLTNDLARQLGVERVALGWVRGQGEAGAVRVIAVSDTELIDRRLAMIQKLEAAMDECLDQEQPVVHPAPPESGEGSDALLARAITHAHRELCASDARLKAASFPLRADDRVVGVITLETTSDRGFDPATIELVQATLDLIAPVVKVRKEADRALVSHALASARRASAMLVGPRHTGWKLLSLVVLAAAIVVVFVRAPYRVEAPMELQARERRMVSAPFNGVIAAVGEGIERGRAVRAGEVLADLDTSELLLSMAQVESEIEQAATQADAALQSGKISEAQQAEAKERGARAQLALLRKRLDDARIVAPIDGTILAGDLKDKVGASVRVGDGLFEIAPLHDMVAVIMVADSDIKLLTDRLARGETVSGQIAAKGEPSKRVGIVVEDIVPLARADEGRNAFEVRARVGRTEPWMRPGMEGLAKIETGDRTLLDIATRRIRDTLRLWLWW